MPCLFFTAPNNIYTFFLFRRIQSNSIQIHWFGHWWKVRICHYYPSRPTSVEQSVAEELKSILGKMANVQIPVFTDWMLPKPGEISIGNTNRWKGQSDQLTAQGYELRTERQRILLRGGSETGLKYGYQDLIELLGARRYKPQPFLRTAAN